jgi:hypothetical protein
VRVISSGAAIPSRPILITTVLAGLLVAAAMLISAAAAQADSGGVSPGSSHSGSGSGSPVQESAISGVSAAYAKFAAILTNRTGLSPRVVAAWALAEGGPKDNPLNMGPGNHYGTVRAGARATEQNLRSALYRNIMRSVGEADLTQIDAIVASPWCASCKGYRRLLRTTYREVHVDGQ